MSLPLTSSRRFVVVLGMLTSIVAFSIDIALPAIPPMVSDLGISMSVGQQVVGLFMAGMAAGQLPFGLISDRIGRMPVIYAGIALFTAAGFLATLSNDTDVLLIARFFQGVGASAGMVLARAIVRDVSSGKESARLMSIMVTIFTAAPMIAPLIGSMLVPLWGWRAPFLATAVTGLFILYGIRTSLRETHIPKDNRRILHQFWHSTTTFLSHRQSVFGVLVVAVSMIGIMGLISGSSSLVIEQYGYPIKNFGFIFALTGVAVLIGASINRRLLLRFGTVQIIGIGAAIAGMAGAQLLVMAWLGEAPFWWLWGSACLYMCATGLLISNATALALDPVPQIAGVASSIMGTIQSGSGAVAAIVSSALYTGTIANVALVVGFSGISALLVFTLRPQILGADRKDA